MTSSGSDRVLYANQPEWADVKPLEQYEGATPLAPIFYTPEYKDATDYFRGIVQTGEMSLRVLDLTEDIIRMNPAHYSAWQYRYNTLLALQAPLDTELRLMDEIAVKYLKTYQVWHHRRLLLMALRSTAAAEATGKDLTEPSSPAAKRAHEAAQRELPFIARILDEDAKNYHTWAHRQWLLAYFNDDNLWEGEMEYIERLLGEDLRNNSVWHHRFFVVFQSGVRAGDEDREAVLKREIAFTKEGISLAPNNASAWNYLRGILDITQTPYASMLDFVLPYADVTTPRSEAPLATTTFNTEEVVDLENPLPSKGAQLPAVAAIEFLADIYESVGGQTTQKAIDLWKSLADEHDKIRKKYWEQRVRDALHAS